MINFRFIFFLCFIGLYSFCTVNLNDSSLSIVEIVNKYKDWPGAADYVIGYKYLRAKGTEQDFKNAEKFFMRAFEKGNLDAAYYLAEIYHTSPSGQKDPVKAAFYCKIAADRGDADAQFNMGLFYDQGVGVEKDPVLAFYYYKKAADANIADAQTNVGLAYRSGRGVTQNFAEALRYLEMAERAGIPEAMVNLGLMYNDGLGVPKDFDKASHYFKRAGDKGNPRGYYELGILYQSASVEKRDYKKAFEFLEKAAKQNYVKAFDGIGFMYENGLGVEKNSSKAIEYYKHAAVAGFTASQYNLGLLLFDQKNYKEGFVWMLKAAEKKYTGALYFLGFNALNGINENGENIEPDYEKAFNYFKEAAQLGSYNAKYYLAQFYRIGLYVQKDSAQAQRIFNEILNSEDTVALFNKALLYEMGDGTSKNLIKAQEYYQKAFLASPSELEKAGLDRVNAKIKRAEDLAAEILRESTASSSTKKSASKGKAQAEPTESETSLPQEFEALEIDIAGEKLKKVLNTELMYDDKSIITDINTETKQITVTSPRDNSVATIYLEDFKLLTKAKLKSLKKFTYDKRIKKWFGSKNELKIYTPQEIDRHAFPQRVDQLVNLYGDKATFVTADGSLERNKMLKGSIKTASGTIYEGIFEYAYYKDKNNNKILYHRFLHPYSRAVAV